ncbi:amidohydrolase family protein, partial [Tsukamurella sp. 8J]|uniref:amidohydrolase family protein n=1 Tax=Tsukamurella sp. 8J TaxID=3031962 RepID=UPI0023BA17D8
MQDIPLLVTGGTVFENPHLSHEDGALLLAGGRVAAVGASVDVEEAAARLGSGVERIDARGHLVLPGFVNPHWHEVLGRGAAALTGRGARPEPFDDRFDVPGPFAHGGDLCRLSTDFDRGYLFGASLEPAEARAIADYSVWVQLRCGTTMLGDFGSMNTADALVGAVERIGLRAALSVWATDGACNPGFERTRPADAVLADFDTLRERTVGCERVTTMLSAIYPSNLSDELARGMVERSEAWGVPLATHVGALPDEVARTTEAFGVSPVRRLARLGWLGSRTVVAHTAWIDDGEVDLLVDAGVHVTHSPAKYGLSGESAVSGTGRIRELAARGLSVSLSTDGEGMPTGGMIEAMRAGMLMHNESASDNTAVVPSRALEMATSAGAVALGAGDRLGTLGAGRAADAVIVRADDWRYLLRARPLEGLVTLGSSADVRTVVVGGRVVLRDGCSTLVDEDALRAAYVDAGG